MPAERNNNRKRPKYDSLSLLQTTHSSWKKDGQKGVSYLIWILFSSLISWRGQTGCCHSLSPGWAVGVCGLVTTAGWALLECIQCPGPQWDSLSTCVWWSSWTEATWSPEDSGRADPAMACWVDGEINQTLSYSKCWRGYTTLYPILLQQHLRERFSSDLASYSEESLSARHIDAATSGVTAQIVTGKENANTLSLLFQAMCVCKVTLAFYFIFRN